LALKPDNDVAYKGIANFGNSPPKPSKPLAQVFQALKSILPSGLVNTSKRLGNFVQALATNLSKHTEENFSKHQETILSKPWELHAILQRLVNEPIVVFHPFKWWPQKAV